ncbi:MAG: hypothetical protein HY286_20005 [Planctomycetes bacterium]|nr:hypothetical protein [Planctomycetota bacterium]
MKASDRRANRQCANRQCANRQCAGFSVIELLILIAGALVIAGLTVPVLRGLTLVSNTESAIETLLRARDFEIRFREKDIATNSLGKPRFGNWSELTRSGLNLEDANVYENGRLLVKHGYVFQIYYSVKSGDPVPDPAAVDADTAKNGFIIYAWPLEYGRSGSSAFAIDPSGLLRVPSSPGVLESKNIVRGYSGLENRPRFDAARSEDYAKNAAAGSVSVNTLPTNTLPINTLPANARPIAERGMDGDMWEIVSASLN